MPPQPGQIVTTQATPFGEVTIRYPHPDDAPAMTDYINALARERTFINLQGEQFTLEQETAWLNAHLSGIAAGNKVQLLIVRDSGIGGIARIERQAGVSRHVAGLGISIAKELRGAGLGALLLDHVLSEAVARLDGLRIVTLDVFGNNHRAIRLYQRFGFVEYGRLKDGICFQDAFVDRVLMVLPIRRE